MHYLAVYFATGATDLVILAINAGKVTAAEKHIANTIFATNCWLFSMMNAYRTDIEICIATAKTNFPT